MCYSGTCPHEISNGPNWGDCGKRNWQKCPDDMTEEELTEASERESDRGDHLYELEKDRRLGL